MSGRPVAETEVGKRVWPIEAVSVCFAYDGLTVLRDVSLHAAAGEIVGVIGPNGAGKSTLLRLLGGVLRPDSGEVRVGGRRLEELGRDEIGRRIAAVPQDTVIEFPFSVTEIVLMGRAPYARGFGFESAADLEIAGAAMQRTGVTDLATREVHELSGGERQRVVLARALAQQSEVLLLDEPTAYLDLRHEMEIFALLREIARQGRAIVIVLHDLTLAAACCDRLVLLSGGTVFASGAPAEVLTEAAIAQVYRIGVTVERGADGQLRIVRRFGW